MSGNTTGGNGGGIDNYAPGGKVSLALNNSTVSGNSADGHSGGLGSYSIEGGVNTVTVVNSTITNNTADMDNSGNGDGGGIYAKDPLTITNSIIAENFDTPNNSGSGNIHPDAHNNVIGSAHNLVGNSTGISGTLGSGSDIVTDTLGLASLANNGGPTTASGLPPFTHALLENSPAVDAGDSTICAIAPINNLDQRGQPRPGVGTSGCDIGAYEFQAPPVMVYLPLITKNLDARGDLVIDSVTADSSGFTVTIRNASANTITDAFWVDIYFNPSSVPVLNQEWHEIAPAGAAWGVTKTLAPNESLTLTFNGPYYNPEESSATFPANATVYAFVDSVHHNTTYGNVWESNEANNVGGPITSSGSAVKGVSSAQGMVPTEGLPDR